jgi:hypothetical protein
MMTTSCGAKVLVDRMQHLTAIALVLAWVVVATYADMQFKAAPEIMSSEFARGIAGYGASGFIAIAAFKQQSWGWIFIAWNCLSLTLGLVLAIAVYHEPMTWRRASASVLLIAAILLAE